MRLNARPCVVFYGVLTRPDTPAPSHQLLKDLLAAQGVDLEFHNYWRPETTQGDLLILATAAPQNLLPDHIKALGQRTLNRRTRLDALARFEGVAQPYGTPSSSEELTDLLDQWDARDAVLKFDWSLRRLGVQQVSRNAQGAARLPSSFDPARDVVMKRIQGAAFTIKVDSFAGHVLGASRLDTREVGSPNWQTIGPRQIEPYDLTPEIEDCVSRAGRALLPYGVGYCGFDVMLDEAGPRVIEVNATNVGTAFWMDRPNPYAERFAQAILATLTQLDTIPDFGALRSMAIEAGNDREANAPKTPPPPPSTGDVEVDVLANLDRMVAQAETYDEAERVLIGEEARAALWDHAQQHVPAWGSHSGPPTGAVSDAEIRTDPAHYLAKWIPPDHGSILFFPSLHSGTNLAATHFTGLFETALRHRALRVAGGQAPYKEVALVDRMSSDQAGLGYDSAASKVWDHLAQQGPAFLSLPDFALDDWLGEIEASGVPENLKGIVVISEGRSVPNQVQVDLPIARLLYTAPTGSYAVLCPSCGHFHGMSDAAEVTLDQSRALLVTGVFNYAMPVFRYDTGLKARRVDAPNCTGVFAGAEGFKLL